MSELIIALCCWFIAEGSGVVQFIRWLVFDNKRIRPFDCALCLSFWVGTFFNIRLITLTPYFEFNPIHGLICGALAVFISKINNRL